MNKKGFTLTEILGVIVIISLLLILVIPGIINRISSSGDEAVEAENQIIYDAADQYIREHPEDYPPGKSGRYCITIQSLIDDGKLAAPVKDVTTGEDISDKSVMVTIYSSGNTEHELKEGAECEEIAALPMIDFIVDPSGSSWVKQRKVTIIYPEMDGNFQASHRIDNGSWIRDSSADDGGNVELVFTKIGQLEARLKGNNIISSKIDIINIDSEIPVITKVEMGSWSNGNNRVRITARDEISGINGLYISTSNTRPSEDDSNWISVSSNGGETKTFVRGLDLGTYYIWVKDKAGNISANGTSLKVVDNTKPTCTITDSGQKGSNQWYTGNVTLKMTTSDKESGVASYGMNTANSAVYNGTTQMTLTYDTKSQTYYGFVKDRAGNVGTCTKNVKRDTVAPSCTLKSSGTPGNNGWYKGNITISFNSKTDATSGVASYGITTSTNASYGNNSSATQTADTKGITYYGYVKDAAGHTNKCSISVKKDTTAPTCTVTKSGTVGNNSWYKSNVTVKLSSRNDSTSGVASYGLSTSTSATYNSITVTVNASDSGSGLATTNTYNWREPILDVVNLLGDNMARLIKIAIWKMPDNWTRSIADIYSELSDISYEDLFSAERYLSYNLCSTLSVINVLKKSFDPTSPDISLFLGKAANAFLPKLVYQLEEYGLPRMISRKIQDSGLINFEDDSVEISEIITQFNNIGREKIIHSLNNLLPFDKFIINYFYDGIS